MAGALTYQAVAGALAYRAMAGPLAYRAMAGALTYRAVAGPETPAMAGALTYQAVALQRGMHNVRLCSCLSAGVGGPGEGAGRAL